MNRRAAGLSERLAARIRREGPISVADFMATALTDPDGGYYTRHDPLGASGDFITAPEISQMFGELIGAWCIDCWHKMGRPDPFVLAELGPGRGTLMADMLRIAALDAGFDAAAQVHLVETSPALRAAQRASLKHRPIVWHDSFADLPALPLLLIANEFFDALPIRQFERFADGWRERLVGLVAGADGTPTRFGFVTSAPCDPGPLPATDDAPIGTIAETCPQGRALAVELATRLVEHGGGALIVDYGYAQGCGDTLQAMRRHRYASILDEPGRADLTAHVDFAALAGHASAAGGEVLGPVDQGTFLRVLGVTSRAAALQANATTAQRDAIDSALRRLINPDEMGTLFKVMAVTAPGMPVPAGFTP